MAENTTFDAPVIGRHIELDRPGIAPREFMMDRRVSIISKAVFACICGFTDWGYTATPGSTHEFTAPQLSHIGIIISLDISPQKYFSCLNELGKYGYIEETDEDGRSWKIALPKEPMVKEKRRVPVNG